MAAIRRTLNVGFVLVLSFVSPALAQVYQWTDENGQNHMTDDPKRVPERYRSKAKEGPDIRATPETIHRDAARRRQEQAENAQSARQHENNEARLAAEAEFRRVAEGCASLTQVEIVVTPGRHVDFFGGSRERFDFRRCMASKGQDIR
jgi:hypothetical protein